MSRERGAKRKTRECKTASRQRKRQDRRSQRKTMKAMSRELDMERRDCQEKKVLRKRDAKRPKDRDVKRKRKCWKDIGFNRQRWHQKNKSRASELSTRSAVKIQRCQEQTGARLPRDHAVNSPDNQAVRLRSYRLSLFFLGFPPFQNFRHSAYPGSTGI